MTLSQLRSHIVNTLAPSVGQREATAMARAIFEDALSVKEIDVVTNPERPVEDDTASRVDAIIEKVLEGEPLQYILGTAHFHGLRLNVRLGVLIPRPETSALVDLITDTVEMRKDLRILDVGTGSGAIAIALASVFPFARVVGMDISTQAIETATHNALNCHTPNVRIEKRDVLTQGLPDGCYDIIVSNPPYVLESEKAEMERTVVDYEPDIALFVPDDNPLRFYRPIAEEALSKLNVGGYLFFEINPRQSQEITDLLDHLGYAEVTVALDLDRRKRYIYAQKP